MLDDDCPGIGIEVVGVEVGAVSVDVGVHSFTRIKPSNTDRHRPVDQASQCFSRHSFQGQAGHVERQPVRRPGPQKLIDGLRRVGQGQLLSAQFGRRERGGKL